MEAGAYLGSERAEVVVGGFAPEGEGVFGGDALAGFDFGADVGERGEAGGHGIILNASRKPVARSRWLAAERGGACWMHVTMVAMSEVAGPAVGAEESSTEPKYTRNNPYFSTVVENYLLTSSDSEKETRHLAFALEAGMTYAPGDAIGVLPENRAEAVAEVLNALGFTGDERVLDHYKVEISFEEALRTRLTIGKLARGAIGQYAKLPGAAGVGGRGYDALKSLCGPDNKAHAEEYCWGREFIDLLTDFPGAVKQPQELFNVLQRLVPRLYSIASSQRVHPDRAETSVRVVRYDAHGRDRQGVASGQLGERAHVGGVLPIFLATNQNFKLPEDDSAPVIMVGPGTGVAPFRAYLEKRPARGAAGQLALLRRTAQGDRFSI